MADLHDAAERGDVDDVRRLLTEGAPVDQLDDADETALHGASAFGTSRWFDSCSDAVQK